MKPLSSKLLLCSLLGSVLCVFPLGAQEPSNPPSSIVPGRVFPHVKPAIPLSVEDKFTIYLKRTYGATAFLKSGVTPGIKQARNQPLEGVQGWDAYG